jgi:hypothetical protein
VRNSAFQLLTVYAKTRSVLSSLNIMGLYLCMCRRWGRGHPEEYTEAITLGEEKFDPDSQEGKKPRAGQILWIRGLTRLQTQVGDINCSPFIH